MISRALSGQDDLQTFARCIGHTPWPFAGGQGRGGHVPTDRSMSSPLSLRAQPVELDVCLSVVVQKQVDRGGVGASSQNLFVRTGHNVADRVIAVGPEQDVFG